MTQVSSPILSQTALRFAGKGSADSGWSRLQRLLDSVTGQGSCDAPGDDFEWTDDTHRSLGARSRNISIEHFPRVKAQIERIQKTATPENYENIRTLAIGFLQIGAERTLLTELKKVTKPNDAKQLQNLGHQYLVTFFEPYGIVAKDIAPEQADKWVMRFMPNLQVELSKRTPYQPALLELCRAALSGTYMDYLHDPTTVVGQTNNYTKARFQEFGLDYDAWFNFDQKVAFAKSDAPVVLDELTQTLGGLMKSMVQEIMPELASELKARGFEFDKAGNLTLLPQHNLMPKSRIMGLILDFGPVLSLSMPYKRFASKDVPALKETLFRLETTLKNLTPDNKADMEVRLWQRNPGHDLFQANLTGSCIALGYGRGEGAIQAVQHTFLQLAEVYNHKKGSVTGKALFFWALDEKKQPVLVLNTFEGREDGCEEELATRDSLLKFAKAYSKAVAGKEVAIYTADHMWNTLRTFDLEKVYKDLHPIGESTTGEYYLDTFGGGWEPLNTVHENTALRVLYNPAKAN